jgi:energy-coupling factor transport system substrate-specific component
MSARADTALLTLTLTLASALGLWALAAPFLDPGRTLSRRAGAAAVRAVARSEDAPLLFVALLGLCLVVVIAALETRRLDARLIAALGVLVGVNTVLRLIPGPGGFNAVFLLPILAGRVFGATLGFRLGTLSLAVSALLVNAVGPWLPFQMLAAGWIGLLSGALPGGGGEPEAGGPGGVGDGPADGSGSGRGGRSGRGSWRDPAHPLRRRLEIAGLAVWGAVAGLAYGVVVDLWFWPFLAATGGTVTWEPGAGLAAAVGRFTLFYLGTSLAWDLGRAAGNAVLIVVAGPPVLRLLRRFSRRLRFTAVAPAGSTDIFPT